MDIAISPKRVFHAVLMANELNAAGHLTTIFSGATRRYFRKLNDQTQVRMAPLPFAQTAKLRKQAHSMRQDHIDSVILDRFVQLRMLTSRPDVFIGFAGSCLKSGETVRRNGGRFLLDRACPSVQFQQQLLRDEAETHGFAKNFHASWFVERQQAEYESADLIICPSRYSANTFPPDLASKIVVAPLMGRIMPRVAQKSRVDGRFVVGIVGGDVVRKGYIYLLKAWSRIRLKGAKLRIRSDQVATSEVLRPYLDDDTIEIVDYVDSMDSFYASCDAFILPSIDDGFGMAAFEAMACGLPTIVTTRCGASELVEHGLSGHVIKPYSETAILDAIQLLAEDIEYWHQLSRGGQQLVEALAQPADGSHYGAALNQAVDPCAKY